MEQFFFENWQSLLRTVVLTILGYLAMILLLRVSGKRTLSKMNAYDFVITIALGSSLASVALDKKVTLTDGVVAFFLLIFLQYAFSKLAMVSSRFHKFLTNEPSLVFYDGRFLSGMMKKERITQAEILNEARAQGFATLDTIQYIILETTGSLSIIKKAATDAEETTLSNVKMPARSVRGVD